uniref:Uncharacterized protein n=1 Tax=Meloidogyne javanica TaxID=6303 RepID=A0A915N926_MELJA
MPFPECLFMSLRKVFETESFPKPYVERQGGQLAKIERHSINSFPLIVTSRTHSMSVLITSYAYELLDPHIIEFIAVKSVCDCFPNNLIVSRVQPLNLLSPGFPLEYCDNLNCSTQISLENPLTTNDVECLQIQFNSFRTELDMDLLHLLQILLGMKRESLYQCLCHGTDSNLKILNGKKNSMKNNFDSKKCLFMDCFWKIEPLKDSSEFNHRLLVKLNLSLSGITEFVEICADNFLIRNPQCHRVDSSNDGIEHRLEFTVWQIPG